MKRIKITENQYQKILLHEQNERILRENILNESWSEVVLGISLMLGVNLTGQNKIIADKSINNKNIMLDIKNVLESKDKTKELVDALTEKGLKDSEYKLASKANSLLSKFNQNAEKNKMGFRLDYKAIENLISFDSDISKEYELTKN